MAKRRSKRTANAKQAALLDNETYAEWRSRVGPSHREKLVLDAFSRAGITFDPSNKIEAQWLNILQLRYDDENDPPMDTRAPPQTVSILSFPRNRIQDVKSRLATERVLSKVKELRSAFLLLKKETARDEIPSVKLNVALNMMAQLIALNDDYKDTADWIADFIDLLNDVSGRQVARLGWGSVLRTADQIHWLSTGFLFAGYTIFGERKNQRLAST